MPDQRVPEVNLQLVSEKLEAVPQVLSTVFAQGGLQIELENDVLLLSGSVDSEEEAQDGSSVLLATDAGYIELSDGDPLRYDFSDSTDDHVSLLKRMVVGDVEPERLADGEELELLTETGLLEGYTSKALGELMTGWAVSKDDSVLDVAAGSGFLLEQAAESTNSSRLVGVEIHPSIARLARTRLGDVEGAEVVNEDFFDWGVSGRQEFQATSQDIEESGKFNVVIGDPPVGIARGEGVQSWAVGNEMSTAL